MKSIKKSIGIRIAVIAMAVILGTVISLLSLRGIRDSVRKKSTATSWHTMALESQKAHVRWIESLSSAMNYRTEVIEHYTIGELEILLRMW